MHEGQLDGARPEATRRCAWLWETGDPVRASRQDHGGYPWPEDDRDRRLAEMADELASRRLQAWVPPWASGWTVLLVRGRAPVLPGVGVVGARAADAYGLACAARSALAAVRLGRSVVSGGAEGCDTAAHRAALEAGGHTSVVLGGGHDRPYPSIHVPLFEEIVSRDGAVISPYLPGTPPSPHRFLFRNGVIAHLAAVVVVARARARSGALSTARHAMGQDTPVLAVPCGAGDGGGRGCLALLEAGAKPMLGPASLARALGEKGGETWPITYGPLADPWARARTMAAREVWEPTPEGEAVLDTLRAHPGLDLDGLVVQSGLPASRLIAALSELELADRIQRDEGGAYVAATHRPREE